MIKYLIFGNFTRLRKVKLYIKVFIFTLVNLNLRIYYYYDKEREGDNVNSKQRRKKNTKTKKEENLNVEKEIQITGISPEEVESHQEENILDDEITDVDFGTPIMDPKTFLGGIFLSNAKRRIY